MAITAYMVSHASDHLSDKHIELWIFWFRKLQKYKDYAIIYSDKIVDSLTAAEGTIKAKMLNALMKEIDDLEVGEVLIRGDREGTHWSQTDERMTLIEEAFDVLFDDITTMIVPSSSVTVNTGTTYTGFNAATGRRAITVCCPVCNSFYNSSIGCHCRKF